MLLSRSPLFWKLASSYALILLAAGGLAWLGIGAVWAGLLALGLGALFARLFAAPVARLAQELGSEVSARVDARLPRDEIRAVADALAHLRGEIDRRAAALSGEEAQLRAMLAGMVEGVIAVDDEDGVVFSNRAARELLRIEGPVPIGARLWELARNADLDELIAEARGSDETARRELSIERAGREVVSLATAHRFRAGRASGVVVVLNDVSELRRLERVRRDFVANVSHELKTPLTSIRGYVETLLSGAIRDDDKNRRFLGKIASNVERLSHLVTDLLSLARIEAERGRPPLEPVDWRALSLSGQRRHEEAARRKGLECRVQAPAGELRVLGDPESMTQVFDNLLDNAIKYTPPGGSVTVRLFAEPTCGVLEVLDDGIGIPPAEIERIFERFYRVDRARSRELGGTGLGLSIVKHLVHAMRGTIRVESTPGTGSRFRVTLPLAPSGPADES